jgi:hypothetical protein
MQWIQIFITNQPLALLYKALESTTNIVNLKACARHKVTDSTVIADPHLASQAHVRMQAHPGALHA